MNSKIIWAFRGGRPKQAPAFIVEMFARLLLIALLPITPGLLGQNSSDPSAEFKRLASELSAARLGGGTEIESLQEKALAYLDSIAASTLNSSSSPDLDAINQRLAGLVSHTPPIGENYRLLKLGGTPAAYALLVNFGQGGPAAVRIYASTNGRYGSAARIDRFTQKDFFDSDIEIVPVSMNENVFVIVSGRTDDLSTGLFSAWRFDGHGIVALWSSDLLQQSNYEAEADGFHLTYCGQPDDDHPSQCNKMTRDLYRYQDGAWKRVESTDLPEVKTAPQP